VPSILLSIPHHPQRDDGDCLAACAAMVLDHAPSRQGTTSRPCSLPAAPRCAARSYPFALDQPQV